MANELCYSLYDSGFHCFEILERIRQNESDAVYNAALTEALFSVHNKMMFNDATYEMGLPVFRTLLDMGARANNYTVYAVTKKYTQHCNPELFRLVIRVLRNCLPVSIGLCRWARYAWKIPGHIVDILDFMLGPIVTIDVNVPPPNNIIQSYLTLVEDLVLRNLHTSQNRGMMFDLLVLAMGSKGSDELIEYIVSATNAAGRDFGEHYLRNGNKNPRIFMM